MSTKKRDWPEIKKIHESRACPMHMRRSYRYSIALSCHYRQWSSWPLSSWIWSKNDRASLYRLSISTSPSVVQKKKILLRSGGKSFSCTIKHLLILLESPMNILNSEFGNNGEFMQCAACSPDLNPKRNIWKVVHV